MRKHWNEGLKYMRRKSEINGKHIEHHVMLSVITILDTSLPEQYINVFSCCFGTLPLTTALNCAFIKLF